MAVLPLDKSRDAEAGPRRDVSQRDALPFDDLKKLPRQRMGLWRDGARVPLRVRAAEHRSDHHRPPILLLGQPDLQARHSRTLKGLVETSGWRWIARHRLRGIEASTGQYTVAER